MKIERLELIAFGPFTDLLIDFTQNNGGLHIVFGYNEAGKSSALRGIKALFYGIPEKTTDNFIHDYQKLKIGCAIRHSDGSTLSFIRRKGRQNTLLSYDGSPIKEDILKRYLGNTEEKLFTRLFGLDHNELIMGGKIIAEGHGDVGESLFAAGLGKINLHEIIKGLESETEELFKPRGKKRINEAISAYNDLKKEISSYVLSGSLWAEKQEKLREIEDKRKELVNNLDRLRNQYNYLERIKNSMSIIAGLKEYTFELKQMGEVILLPHSFSDERKRFVAEINYEETSLKEISRQLKDLKVDIDKINIPEEILKHEKIISELYQRLGSHLKAEKDSRDLQAQINQLNADAARILKEIMPHLSFANVESIRLTKGRKIKIRNLAKRYSLLSANLRDKEKSLKTLESEIEKLIIKLEHIDNPIDIRNLKTSLKGIRPYENLEVELEDLRGKQETELKKARILLKRLSLGDREYEDLEGLSVPLNETIDKFDSSFEELQSNLKFINDRIKTTEDKINQLEIDLNAIDYSGYIPSESDLRAARKWRQKGWDLVLGEWLHGKRDDDALREFANQRDLRSAYEDSVSRADDIADRLRREADRVAKKSHITAEVNKLKESKNILEIEKEECIKQLQNLQIEWQRIWLSSNIQPQTPREMRAWLNSYHQLIKQLETINDFKAKIKDIEFRIEKLKAEIISNIESAGLDIHNKQTNLKNLIIIADAHIEKVEKAANENQRLHERIEDLRKRKAKEENEYNATAIEIDELRPEWLAILRDLGLPDNATETDVEAYLERNQELFDKIDNATALYKRIDDIKKDAADFSDDVFELTGRIAPDLTSITVEQAVSEIYYRLSKTKGDFVRLSEIEKQINEKLELQNKLIQSLNKNKARLKNLCQQARCSDVGKLEEIEYKSERARFLTDMIEQSRRHILAYCGTQSIDEFIKEAENVDIDSLDSQLRNIGDEIHNYEIELSEIDRTIGGLKSELKRMDGSANAAEAKEKAEGILSGIKKDVERYLKLRIALSILRYEIDRYRERNQSPLLRRAGEIFSQLTLNSFSSIKTVYNESDKPVLVCLRPSGEMIGIDGLSEGSCDQLYLSLRLASLENYLKENEPLPFIIDDILINFDDRRAQAALRVLNELTEKTQVIFFTHHKHLVDIAEATIAKELLQVHYLHNAETLFKDSIKI